MRTYEDSYRHKGLRKKLVDLLQSKGISDERVLAAINNIPRHFFLDSAFDEKAYEDKAFPIAVGQTISQPYTVAYQTQLLEPKPFDKVLEIGTGSGYQAAVLAQLSKEVYAVERIGPLLEKAKANMRTLQQFNVRLKHADGMLGLPEAGPFDSIIVAAAGLNIPPALLSQLAPGGRLVLPVGASEQYLSLIERSPQGYTETRLDAVRFVPLLSGTQ